MNFEDEIIMESVGLETLSEGKLRRVGLYIKDDFTGEFNVRNFELAMQDAIDDHDADALKNIGFMLHKISNGDMMNLPRTLKKTFSKYSRMQVGQYRADAKSLLQKVNHEIKRMDGTDPETHYNKRQRQEEMTQQAAMTGMFVGAAVNN